jgi:predicted Zn-dependent protease
MSMIEEGEEHTEVDASAEALFGRRAVDTRPEGPSPLSTKPNARPPQTTQPGGPPSLTTKPGTMPLLATQPSAPIHVTTRGPVAGPEEATLFNGPRHISDPITSGEINTPDPPREIRSSLEVVQIEPPDDFGQAASGAETRLAARALLENEAKATERRPEGRRVDQATVDQHPRFIATPPPSRVTRPVDQLEREDLERRRQSSVSFDHATPSSDPSIMLTEDEVVFVPSPSDELSVDVPLPSGRFTEEPAPVEAPPETFESDVDTDGATRLRARTDGWEPVQSAPRPVVAELEPLGRGPHDRVIGSDELHPRLTAEPARPRKPAAEPHRDEHRSRSSRKRRKNRSGLVSRALEALPGGGQGQRRWLTIVIVAVVVVVPGLLGGLFIKEWRAQVQNRRRQELALKKLASGNFPGYQAAELLYRQILAERDDRRAAAMRAKVLAQLAFEFGESPEPAQRAVQALGSGNMPEEREARVYLALAKGELELAAREAAALLKDRPGAQARYLVGQAYLLLDQPENAVTALHTASNEDPQNPIVLHALGVAESAVRHKDLAFEAYAKALTANANHVATIIDRALLQLQLGLDREAAAGSLEGVVGKLVADASPGQLARAYVGLAELELQKGNVGAARTALSSAAANRRDHPLLLEELAKAYADAFELDPAEREARRALAVSGRLTPRLILAEVALRRSRPVQALTLLEESGSTRPEALVLRALAKLGLGRNAEARTDAEQARDLDPSSIPAQVALARIDLAEGKIEAAQRRLDALEQKGKDAEVAWVLGQVALARKQPDRARTFFREALHRQPLLLQARLALARLLHEAGQLAEARDEVNRVLAANAAYVPARRELAALALDLGDAVAARDEFDALSERDADVDTLLGAARARLLLADARGADERVERALKLRPNGADLELAQCLKARALLADHRASEAIQLLLKVVPSEVRGEPVALLIEAYLDYGRPEWAERAVELAPVASRTGIELTLAKARLSLEQARQAAGKTLAEEGLARLRSGASPVWLRAQALALVGRAEFELGNARAAWKSLKSALELDPHSVRAQYALGLAAVELKRPEDAVSAFEGALANDPRFAEAQFYLGRTRRELGDPRAEESLRAYLELEPRGAWADEARRLLRGEPVTPTSDPPRTHHRGP